VKLEVSDVCFSYNQHLALEDISVTVEKGSIVSLVGPNGSGKTTLIKCMNRILKPHSGTIRISDRDIHEMKLVELAKTFGYVPQVQVTFFPFTVFDAVLLGRRPYIKFGVRASDKEIVSKILEQVGIEHLAFRHFNELSGGERQKVVIARALAQEPEILLLDEPTSSLDIKHQLEILDIIKDISALKEVTVIISIHDLNLASRYSDKIVLMKEGKIFTNKTPDEAITKENIREVFGVEVKINDNSGKPYTIPITPINDI
jgi:iron complex transport system ATP-binding protein